MKIEAVFEIEKETKGTYRYREIESEEPPKVGIIYVKKWALKKMNKGEIPRKIKITIAPE